MTTLRRRSFRGIRARGPRRRTTWVQRLSQFVMTGAASSQFIDISHPTIVAQENSGGVCLRMIGDLRFENADAAADHIVLGIGIAVVTLDAFTSGALPDPLGDLNHDWYFWRASAWHLPGVDPGQDAFTTMPIDIRSSRRLRGGYRLIVIVEKEVTTEVSWNMVFSLRSVWALQA